MNLSCAHPKSVHGKVIGLSSHEPSYQLSIAIVRGVPNRILRTNTTYAYSVMLVSVRVSALWCATQHMRAPGNGTRTRVGAARRTARERTSSTSTGTGLARPIPVGGRRRTAPHHAQFVALFSSGDCAYSMPSNDELAMLWSHAPCGRLSAKEQLRAWALREAMQDFGEGRVNYQWIANKLAVGGGGCPTRDAVRKLLCRCDSDSEWYPGKSYQEKRGPAPLLNASKRRAISTSMMAAKKRGHEPGAALAVRFCQKATLNPKTQAPFTAKYIRKVFTEDCYDVTPDQPWKYQRVIQKTWLPPALQEQRLAWARWELAHAQSPEWYFRNVVWFDPCSTVIPAGPKKAADLEQAARGTQRYISDDARAYSRNLRAPKQCATQRSWKDRRIWWVLVLTNGRIAVEVMPAGWKDNATGMATFAQQLPDILRRMLGRRSDLPNILYTDRGPGMFVPRTGQATTAYADSVQQAGLQLYTGTDASRQPADVPDVLLHETAIACFKRKLVATPSIVDPWKETHEQFQSRVDNVVQAANGQYNFRSLCGSYLERLELLVERKGDRLKT